MLIFCSIFFIIIDSIYFDNLSYNLLLNFNLQPLIWKYLSKLLLFINKGREKVYFNEN